MERREASVPRHGTQGASQAPGVPRHKRVHARLVTRRGHAQRVLRTHPNVSRRSAHPSIRVSEAKVQAPGVKNAPRERDGLFDIVRWKLPKTVRRRAASLAVLILRSACGRGFANSNGRARVSKDEDEGAPRVLAKRTQRAFWPSGSSPRKAGAHDHCWWLWVPALAALGRDDDRLVRGKDQPAAARNARRRNFIVSGLLFTMRFATHTCRPH